MTARAGGQAVERAFKARFPRRVCHAVRAARALLRQKRRVSLLRHRVQAHAPALAGDVVVKGRKPPHAAVAVPREAAALFRDQQAEVRVGQDVHPRARRVAVRKHVDLIAVVSKAAVAVVRQPGGGRQRALHRQGGKAGERFRRTRGLASIHGQRRQKRALRVVQPPRVQHIHAALAVPTRVQMAGGNQPVNFLARRLAIFVFPGAQHRHRQRNPRPLQIFMRADQP